MMTLHIRFCLLLGESLAEFNRTQNKWLSLTEFPFFFFNERIIYLIFFSLKLTILMVFIADILCQANSVALFKRTDRFLLDSPGLFHIGFYRLVGHLLQQLPKQDSHPFEHFTRMKTRGLSIYTRLLMNIRYPL